MTQNITGSLLKSMVINAAAAINNHKQEINELNVFPVPDGDTGTNMSLTVSAAEKALETLNADSIGRVADEVAGATLRGARGNSGVILSLLFRGFSRSVKDKESADAKDFAQALTSGVEAAYKAVMKPAEGTILTVSRLVAAAAVTSASSENNIEKVIEYALKEGHIALAETINQNPVLQKAGVIDAGAKGYLYMLSGMLAALRGEVIQKVESDAESEGKADFSQYSSEDIEFTYCTELMVERETKKDPNDLRALLDKLGDSVVVIDDDEVIKIHVHTDEPGVAMTEALKYGPLLSSKIENMRMQHSEAAHHQSEHAVGKKAEAAAPAAEEEMKDFAIVTVCVGDGIEEIFKELGADRIIVGGQTMNPSTEDILKKIISAPSDTVFVLPNNKNIILAAEQCVPLTEKRVIVIPSKTIPQGVVAMLTIDGGGEIEEMAENMRGALKTVHTAHITKAVRNSTFDGKNIKEGEFIALLEDTIIGSGSDAAVVISAVASAFEKIAPEFITIYYGQEITECEAGDTAEKIGSDLGDSEVTLVAGGQPIYHYIISAE